MTTGHGEDVWQRREEIRATCRGTNARHRRSLGRKHERAIGATMPLSRYKTADPSLMEAMRAAFYQLCDVLQLSCDREDQLTEVVVTKIVALAEAGERDPEKLCNAVLADLETPAKGRTSNALQQPMMAQEADGR
jgi:hypothetical protein